MRRLLDKVFGKFGSRTIRVHVAVLRDPSKSPEQIRDFLNDMLPAIEAGKLSSEQLDQKRRDFYGADPKMIFVGYAGRDKKGCVSPDRHAERGFFGPPSER